MTVSSFQLYRYKSHTETTLQKNVITDLLHLFFLYAHFFLEKNIRKSKT